MRKYSKFNYIFPSSFEASRHWLDYDKLPYKKGRKQIGICKEQKSGFALA